ncbi:MAG: DUF4013 domain-containing protein [Raoultibacter sp.]
MQTMQAGYFKTAWEDIKNSPGWVGKVFLLALVMLIPIFGQIVLAGYLYGWARDKAWGVHSPLPAHIFGNVDGKLYSRGFFVCVLGLVCALVPFFVQILFDMFTGVSDSLYGWNSHQGAGPLLMISAFLGMLSLIFSVILSVAASFFLWVGSLRISVYDRLSAGFQFGKIWAMFRHDPNGLLRILGMNIILVLVAGLLMSIAIFILIFVAFFFAMSLGMTGAASTMGDLGPAAMGFVGIILLLVFVLLLIGGYLFSAFMVFTEMLTARALGYWMLQFEVPAWRGQDDPMPFELRERS